MHRSKKNMLFPKGHDILSQNVSEELPKTYLKETLFLIYNKNIPYLKIPICRTHLVPHTMNSYYQHHKRKNKRKHILII